MSTHGPQLDRLFDLLATRAVEGLSDTETSELATLLTAHPEVDPGAFDTAAADAFMEPRTDITHTLPASLAERIARDARAIVAEHASSRRSGVIRPIPLLSSSAKSPTRAAFWPWLAAAASIALALVAWWPRMFPARVPGPIPVLSLAQQRQALIDQASDVRTIPWSPTADPDAKGLSGDVVWSDSLNRGYVRFNGLAANDPKAGQYQLWIFDAQGDARYPVDGGVFDVAAPNAAASTQAVIPINAKIRVSKAAAFAVTIERPGGVVVTSRERLLALAK